MRFKARSDLHKIAVQEKEVSADTASSRNVSCIAFKKLQKIMVVRSNRYSLSMNRVYTERNFQLELLLQKKRNLSLDSSQEKIGQLCCRS